MARTTQPELAGYRELSSRWCNLSTRYILTFLAEAGVDTKRKDARDLITNLHRAWGGKAAADMVIDYRERTATAPVLSFDHVSVAIGELVELAREWPEHELLESVYNAVHEHIDHYRRSQQYATGRHTS